MEPTADFSQLFDVKPLETIPQSTGGWLWLVSVVGFLMVLAFLGWRAWRFKRPKAAQPSLQECWERLVTMLRDQWSELSRDKQEQLLHDVIYATAHRLFGRPMDDKTPDELKAIWCRRKSRAADNDNQSVSDDWTQVLDDWERLRYASYHKDDSLRDDLRRRLLEILRNFDRNGQNQQTQMTSNGADGHISVS